MSDLSVLQEALCVSFKNVSLLQQALVHTSYVNENPGVMPGSNERLEFLGDAVLGFIVAEKLYHDFPELDEGAMTKLRSVLVRGEALARIAAGLDLGRYLYLGRGEESTGGREKPANLARALEAVIAAIFLDQGEGTVREAILKLLRDEMERAVEWGLWIDHKSRLQELVQSRTRLTPVYKIVETVGPEHECQFTVDVIAGDNVLGRGYGRSKKLAESEAARSALEKLLTDFTA